MAVLENTHVLRHPPSRPVALVPAGPEGGQVGPGEERVGILPLEMHT